MSIPFAPLARATLHAGGRSVEYLTGGRGAAVVVLHPRLEGEETSGILRALARRCRVVAPLATDGRACSLDELFEGLGIERAALVVEATVAHAAIAFAAGRGDGASRIAVLRSREEEDAAVAAPWSESSAEARAWLESDVVRDPTALEELLSYLEVGPALPAVGPRER